METVECWEREEMTANKEKLACEDQLAPVEPQESWEHLEWLVNVERLDQMVAWETKDHQDQLD